MTYRADVDGLRAIAVLAVLGFHAFPAVVPGGFVGVDIFFVISGFLITGIILDAAAAGTFSLAGFFARRIRRIFPALALVLAACLVAGWYLLFEDQFMALGKHVAAGAGFVSNFVLWREAGYFDASAETKPLLHLWSLGIEEQFYLAWPLLVVAMWRRVDILVVAAFVWAVSLAFNLVSIRTDLVGTFYSPATRAWELMSGSMLACLARPGGPGLAHAVAAGFGRLLARPGARAVMSVAGAAAVAGASFLLDGSRHYPGAWAIVPVAGAALMIAAGADAPINRLVLAARPMVWVGLISYPLYLWHWPLLAFARILESGEPPAWLRAVAIAGAGVLAWLTYRFVEMPIRFGRGRRGVVPGLSVVMAVLLAAGWQTYRLDGWPSRPINLSDRGHFVKYYEGIKKFEMPAAYREECDFMDWTNERTRDAIAPSCTQPGTDRTVLLWGDSFAQALSAGIRSSLPAGTRLAQVATSHCQPSVEANDFGVPDGRCRRANEFALAALASLRPALVIVAQRADHEATDWTTFARRVRAAGAGRVILVGPSPQWLPSLPAVVVRHHWPRPPARVSEGLDRRLLDLDRELQAQYGSSTELDYVSLVARLCQADGCTAIVPGTDPPELITFDMGHLTPRGSRFVAGLALGALLAAPGY